MPDVYVSGFGAHRWVLTRGRARYEILIDGDGGYSGNTTAVFCYRLNQQGEAPKRSLWAAVYQGDPDLYLPAYQSFQDWQTARRAPGGVTRVSLSEYNSQNARSQGCSNAPAPGTIFMNQPSPHGVCPAALAAPGVRLVA